MSQRLPDLELTHGQLLWSIRYGREPTQLLKDQVRYLRTLGIPAAAKDQAKGPGTPITYDFYDLVEIGLAVTALDFRFKAYTEYSVSSRGESEYDQNGSLVGDKLTFVVNQNAGGIQ